MEKPLRSIPRDARRLASLSEGQPRELRLLCLDQRRGRPAENWHDP
jgi:hypothetical protein